LARVFSALGPFLSGVRDQGKPDMYSEGLALVYDHPNVLTLARLGSLPFFWLACVVVYLAALRWYGKAQAGLAVFLFTLLPPVLAHAGLATTDMALTATFGLAMYALLRWAETPTPAWGSMLGFACALTILSKFSSLVFFPACVGMLLIWAVVTQGAGELRHWMTARHAISASIAAVVVVAAIFAAYRFSFEPFFAGIAQVREHQSDGHPSYLLGNVSLSGFYWFYPVALAVKTPLGFLVLIGGALWLAWKRRTDAAWAGPVAVALGIMAVGLWSRINIGTRHILPIYFCFALLSAAFVWDRFERWAPKVVLALVVWIVVSGAWQSPDYIAYFNELAGTEPERILADSDLDWGQDMKRLGAQLAKLRAQQVAFTPFFGVDPSKYAGFPQVTRGNPLQPDYGWNALSITFWKSYKMGLIGAQPPLDPWPDRMKPVQRVGRGMFLYYVAPPAQR
jgi:4-amino-4-deoxy-L-arabinose transferase-like glycosyltransferase